MNAYPPIKIVPQARDTLALRVTSDGIEARIPAQLDPASDRVQHFVSVGLSKLQPDAPLSSPAQRTPDDLRQRVSDWATKLEVAIARIQIRPMRRKWASISTQGNLTLADDLLRLPADLVDYILVHELLHLKIPDHGKGFQVALSCILPDWRGREMELTKWAVPKMHV